MKQVNSVISLDQNTYISALSPIEHNISNHCDDLDSPLSEELKKTLQCKIGQLLWLSSQTRPDVCYDVSHLAANLTKATSRDVLMINRTIRKLKRQQLSLTFKPLTGTTHLVAYTDASLGGLPNGGSQCGCLVFLADNAGNCNLLSWNSKQIRRIVRSSLSAETLGMSECLDSVIFISMLYKELTFGHAKKGEIGITLITDSKSVIDGLKSSKPVSEKRLRFDINSVKEALQENQLQCVKWVDTKKQLADSLTKQGASPQNLYETIVKGKLNLN